MFTIKLIRNQTPDAGQRLRICEAQSFTIINESPALKGITLHRASQADDEVYYVGTMTPATAYADEYRVYDRAIIENAAGKTSEVIWARPVGDSPGEAVETAA